MRKLITIIGAAIIMLALLAVGTALACHNTVTGTVSCKTNMQAVAWTITNDAPFFTETGTYTTTEGASGSFTLAGGQATTIVELVEGDTKGTDTFTATATWQTRKGSHTATATGAVSLAGGCLSPPLNPPPLPKKPHHRKPVVKVSQPRAVVQAPPPVTISVQEAASLGGGG